MSDGLRADPQEPKMGRDQWTWTRQRVYRCSCETCWNAYAAGWEDVDGKRLPASPWPMTPEESGCGCGDYLCQKCCPGGVSRG